MPALRPEPKPAFRAAVLLLASAAGCSGCAADRWELVALPVETLAFSADARIDYVRQHPTLTRAEKDEILQGRLIPGMGAEDVVRLVGEPDRRTLLPAEAEPGATEATTEEWVYPEWSRVRGGPSAPGLVYVADGVVVNFIAVEPSGRRRWARAPKSGGASPRSGRPFPPKTRRPGVPGILE